MSFRELARELYRAKQQVERLEKLLSSCPQAETEARQIELDEARGECRQLQQILDSRKASSLLPRKF